MTCLRGLNEPLIKVEVLQLIKVTFMRGDGSEQSPIRHVDRYHDMEGNPVVEMDPCHCEEVLT